RRQLSGVADAARRPVTGRDHGAVAGRARAGRTVKPLRRISLRAFPLAAGRRRPAYSGRGRSSETAGTGKTRPEAVARADAHRATTDLPHCRSPRLARRTAGPGQLLAR